jgi:hypothetical protein
MNPPETRGKVLPMRLLPKPDRPTSGLRLTAFEGAQRLIELCKKPRDVADKRQFFLAIVYILNDYSDDVIRDVTDPLKGLPGSLKYPLALADVTRECGMAKLKYASTDEWFGVRTPPPAQTPHEPAPVRPPEWPPIARRLADKFLPATFKAVFADARLGGFADGCLTIVVPAGAAEMATERRATVLWNAQQEFPQVTSINILECG